MAPICTGLGRMRPSILLYDWDNTLVDGWAAIAAALNAAFDAFDLPRWSVDDTKERVRTSLRESFPPMFGARWEEARDLFYATLSEQHLTHLRPMPNALDALRAGAAWPQGVVSNKTGGFLRKEVAHLGWDGHFQTVIGAGDAAADKPRPDSILLALAKTGYAPDRSVWYLGDTASDMQAARAAGVTAVLVGDAAHDGGIDKAGADIHVSSMMDLAARLRALT
jgi:phosphoglycolate phosphatase